MRTKVDGEGVYLVKKLMLHFSTVTLVLLCAVTQAAVITVNTANNVNPGPNVTNLVAALKGLHDGDTIQFNIPGPGPFYISTPTNGYPFLTNDNIVIDGYRQPGSSPNTNSILQPNNARIQIVLDSRDGPEQRTRLGALSNSGFFDSDSAILAVQGAKNFKIRGVSFLSRHTADTSPNPSDPGDPEIYCIALINDATNARISGCWFGLDPNGTTVAGGRSAVAAFKDSSGASASGLVFGTDGDGQNDAAEFNICMGMGLAINLETPNVKVAGNFINVFPNGTSFLDLSTIMLLDGGGIEAIENGAADNMIIGTEGDGVSDANELNVIGPVFSDTLARFSRAATNIVFAGNHVWVGIDGQTIVPRNPFNSDSDITLFRIFKQSSIRVGSNFDGLSDPLEGNRVYNLGCQLEPCDAPLRAFIGLDDSNNENGGADAARIVFRGNSLVNLSSDVLMQDQNVLISTYYSTVMADSANNFTTTLSTNNTGTQLLVTVPPPNTNNYPTTIVDFYAVDPVAWTNNSRALGKTYLGSVIDGSAQDRDSAPDRIAFDIGNLNLSATTTVTALITYSKDSGLTTQAGRAVSAVFSCPVTVNPVASPPQIGPFSYGAGIVTLVVSGGTPPYQLQVREDLTAGSWENLGAAFTNTPITFPATNQSRSFYRVTGQ